jgi:hypothetical protein
MQDSAENKLEYMRVFRQYVTQTEALLEQVMQLLRRCIDD